MRCIIFLISLLFVASSCSDEVVEGSTTSWKLTSILIDATPVPIIDGESFSPQFTTVGEDIDYILTLDNVNLTWSATGNYTMFTEFDIAMIPVIRESFEDKSSSGSFSVLKNGYEFDDSLFDVELNGLNWMNTENEDMKFILSEDGNTLVQDQWFQNVEVISQMNANLKVQTTWELL